MSTFVLLRGARHGGWGRQRVAPALRAVRHEVYAPASPASATASTC
ncbi:hypothetical protein [Streptomyces sp. NPDC001843]